MQNTGNESQGDRTFSYINRKDGSKISRHQVLIISCLSALVLVSCSPIQQEKGSLEIYFCPGNCEELYSNLILSSSSSRCAFYDLDSDMLIESLKKKKTEVLVFEENHDDFGTKVFSKGLMHNKFCIINDTTVITGSANPTERGFNVNSNNIVVIESKTLVRNYNREFEELKERNNAKTKKTKVNLSGILIENYFCPEDDCENKILRELQKAKKSIYFMTFSFTSDPIGDLLLEKSKEIKVQGVMESFGLNKYSEFHKLNGTVPIAMERTGAIMHHKVFIIDKKIVITGSYNPTKSANEKNDENIITIHDEEIAKKYINEFHYLNKHENTK